MADQMPPLGKILGVIFIMAIAVIPVARTLFCYQCGGTIANDSCNTDMEGMLETFYKRSYVYKQDCSEYKTAWDRCMIETTRNNKDELTLIHRGCHDGIHFTKELLGPRFQAMTTNNMSTCELVGERFVCYRFCDTDFCNGPQPYCNETKTSGEYGEEKKCGGSAVFSLETVAVLDAMCLILTFIFFGLS